MRIGKRSRATKTSGPPSWPSFAEAGKEQLKDAIPEAPNNPVDCFREMPQHLAEYPNKEWTTAGAAAWRNEANEERSGEEEKSRSRTMARDQSPRT